MSSPFSQEPRELLNQWQIDPPTDLNLADRVLHQIQTPLADPPMEGPRLNWLVRLGQQPAYAGGFAAVFLGAGALIALMAVSGMRTSAGLEGPGEYRLAIDPLYRMDHLADIKAGDGRSADDTLHLSLDWLKKELELNEEQFAKLESLHGAFVATLAGQFAGLKNSEAQVRDFEALRARSEVIDFIQVYHTFTHYRQLQNQASLTTADLVEQVSNLITAEQRHRYLELIGSRPNSPGTRKSGESPTI